MRPCVTNKTEKDEGASKLRIMKGKEMRMGKRKGKRKTMIWKHMHGGKTMEGPERIDVTRQALVSYTCT